MPKAGCTRRANCMCDDLTAHRGNSLIILQHAVHQGKRPGAEDGLPQLVDTLQRAQLGVMLLAALYSAPARLSSANGAQAPSAGTVAARAPAIRLRCAFDPIHPLTARRRATI